MQGEDLIREGRNLSSYAAAKTLNLLADEYNKEIDLMFGRLHEHRYSGAEAINYDPNEYHRCAFRSMAELDRFVQDMRQQGIEVTATNCRFNGQYLAEIPNTNRVLVSPDDNTSTSYNSSSYNQDSQTQDSLNQQNSFVPPNTEQRTNTQETPLSNIEQTTEANSVSTSNEPSYSENSQTQSNCNQSNNFENPITDNTYNTDNAYNDSRFQNEVASANPAGGDASKPIINKESNVADSNNAVGTSEPTTPSPASPPTTPPVEKNTVPADNGEQKNGERQQGQLEQQQQQQQGCNYRYRSAEEIISDYQNRTFETVSAVRDIKNADENEPINKAGMVNRFESDFDALGTFLINANKVVRFLSPEEYGSDSNQKIFLGKVKDGCANPQVHTGKSKKAIVLNDDTVIVDGVVVTDERTRNYVLSQHSERKWNAYANIAVADLRRGRFDTRNQDTLNSLRNVREHYTSIIEGRPDNSNLTGLSVRERNHHHRTRNSRNQRTPEPISQEDYLEFAEKAQSKAQKGINKLTNVSAADHKRFSEQERLHLNSLRISDGIYRQEYTSNEVKSTARRKGGVLDNYVSSFNTEAVALGISGATIELNADEIALLKEAVSSGILLGSTTETLQRVIRSGRLTTYRDRFAVTDALREMNRSSAVSLTSGERQTSESLLSDQRGIVLDDMESAMFTQSRTTMLCLEKDFGLRFENGQIGREDVLRINEAFIKKCEDAGIQLVDNRGRLDLKTLKNISDKQLAEMKMTRESLNVVIAINEKGAWGTPDRKEELKKSGKLAQMAMSGFMKLADDDELSQTLGTMQQTASVPSYVKSAATSVSQSAKAAKIRIETAKAKATGRKAENNPRPKNNRNPRNRENRVTLSKEVNKEANQLFLFGDQVKNSRLNRSERSFVTRIGNRFSALKKAIVENPAIVAFNKLKAMFIKLAIRGLLIILGGLMFMSQFIVLILLIIMIIQAIMNAIDGVLGFLGGESACKQLYYYLADEEEGWRENLENRAGLHGDRAKIRYTSDFLTYDEYLAAISSMLDIDGTLYINPFDNVEGLASENNNKDALTSVNSYSGAFATEISTNVNKYSEKDVASNSFVSVENGHTSNIKDILAMTDVMYQFDIDGSYDGESDGAGGGTGLHGIMGKNPAQIDWENFQSQFIGTMKWIGDSIATFFCNLFGADEDYKDRKIFVGDTCSYATIQNYVTTLFEMSHQQQYSLGVEYYPISDINVNVNGEIEKGEMSQKEASMLGVCYAPEKKDFKIYYNPTRNTIAPYLESYSGVKYDLDQDTFDIKIPMSSCTESDSLCLWAGMGADQDTLDKIEDNSCWSENSEASSYEGKTFSAISTGSATSSSLSDAGNSAYIQAYNSAISSLESQINNLVLDNDEYIFSYDHGSFTHIAYEKNNNWNNTVISNAIGGNGGINMRNREIESYWREVTLKLTATVYYIDTDCYSRECKGHEFEYCGGHVCTHCQGVVYSVTNEQLAVTGVYDDNEMLPVISDFDFETFGFNKLKGKYNNSDNKIDYSSAKIASTTGGSLLPEADVQGSIVAHRGLNLYIEDEELKSGIKIREENLRLLMRDIFDVDCAIDKGDNIFPFGPKYEKYLGWDEDNMTFVISRLSSNWKDLYEFDVPYEIGETPVGTDDIKLIVDALKESYGDLFDEEREKAVRLALLWVGRGHYSEDHKDHAFLSQLCDAMNPRFSGNCTAGDDEGFAKFILNRGGKLNDVTGNIVGWSPVGSLDSLKPADVMLHRGSASYSYTDITFNSANITKEKAETLLAYKEERYVLFIGKLDNEITLSDGTVIAADTPITVDLSKEAGTICLRTQSPADWEDVSNDKNYYWVENPDAKTMVKRFN